MSSRRTKAERTLGDLSGVGPATRKDFELLGIKSVAALARRSPARMYERLCVLTNCRQDPCVLDVFAAAVAQARNPRLPKNQCDWWYWSRVRKEAEAGRSDGRKRRSGGGPSSPRPRRAVQ